MKLISTLAVVVLTCLTGCSSQTEPEPREQSSETPQTSASATGVKGACEQFNTLYAEFAAVTAGDSDAYDKIYQRSEEAKKSAPGDTAGLSLPSACSPSSAPQGTNSRKETKKALTDAVMANSGPCTAEGVTLKV